MKALALSALLLLATPSISLAEDDAPVTCAQNLDDIAYVKVRINDLIAKFQAEKDGRHKMILALEGQNMGKLYDFLQDWHKQHCSDI